MPGDSRYISCSAAIDLEATPNWSRLLRAVVARHGLALAGPPTASAALDGEMVYFSLVRPEGLNAAAASTLASKVTSDVESTWARAAALHSESALVDLEQAELALAAAKRELGNAIQQQARAERGELTREQMKDALAASRVALQFLGDVLGISQTASGLFGG